MDVIFIKNRNTNSMLEHAGLKLDKVCNSVETV